MCRHDPKFSALMGRCNHCTGLWHIHLIKTCIRLYIQFIKLYSNLLASFIENFYCRLNWLCNNWQDRGCRNPDITLFSINMHKCKLFTNTDGVHSSIRDGSREAKEINCEWQVLGWGWDCRGVPKKQPWAHSSEPTCPQALPCSSTSEEAALVPLCLCQAQRNKNLSGNCVSSVHKRKMWLLNLCILHLSWKIKWINMIHKLRTNLIQNRHHKNTNDHSCYLIKWEWIS